MPENVYTYMKFVRYRELENWSFQYSINSNLNFGRKFELKKISSFLTRNKTTVTVEDNVSYKRVTIKTNNGGCCLRDELSGKLIGTKQQFVISQGQFILSKIDARNGAMGVVPSECDKAIITGNFWTFDVNEKLIDSHYLSLVTTTKAFVDFAEKASNGTTNRHYLQEPLFLSQKIPLPTIEEQRTLVSAFNDKIKTANDLECKASQIEGGIGDYLMKTLGATKKQGMVNRNSKYQYLKFIHFMDVCEWGMDIITKKQNREIFKYPVKKIKSLCQLGSGGTPSRSYSQYYKGNIPWVKTGEVLNDVIMETEEHITEEAIANSSAKLYPKGSLIIAMYGQGDTRGRTAKLGIDATTNQACAVLHDIDNNVVSTDYLWYYLQGRYDDLRSLASGNNQPNLNAGKINNYDVVVPPMDIQNEMVAHIKEQKTLAKQLKQKAASIREDALKEFENEIFEI